MPSPANGACPAGLRGKLGYVRNPEFCIAWLDEFSDELGFRITLRYLGSQEEFVYQVGPDVHDFFFPASDWPDALSATPCASCSIRRKDFSVLVQALLPTGEITMGGFATIIM